MKPLYRWKPTHRAWDGTLLMLCDGPEGGPAGPAYSKKDWEYGDYADYELWEDGNWYMHGEPTSVEPLKR